MWELDDREACLVSDESHGSRVPGKAPPPLHVGVVIRHGVQTLLGSLATASYAPASADQATPSSASAAADAAAPTSPSTRL